MRTDQSSGGHQGWRPEDREHHVGGALWMGEACVRGHQGETLVGTWCERRGSYRQAWAG